MKTRLTTFWVVLFLGLRAFGQTGEIVLANSDGTIYRPTNFWAANSAAIASALNTSLLVPNSRLIGTTGSLTGGGTLAADRTLQLVGDSTTPGASKYYGTDGGGTKGYYPLPAGSGASSFSGLSDVSTNQYGVGRPVVRHPDGRVGDTNSMTVGQVNASSISLGSTVVSLVNGGTAATNVAGAQQSLQLVPGTHVQAQSSVLQAITDLTGTGLLVKVGPDSFAARALAAGPGLTIDDADAVAASPTIRLALSDEINGGAPNAPTGKVHWSEIIGMPAGIADGADAQGAFTWDVDVDKDTTSGGATPVYTNLISEGYTHQLRLFVTAGGPTNQGAWQHNVAIGRSASVTNFGASLYSGIALGSGVGMTSYCSQAGSACVVYVRGITNENVHWNIVGSRITTTNGAPSGGGGQIFLVNESFEGTGNPGGWTTSGSPNWDYTTSPINGAQSFYAATTSDLAYYAFTAGTNVWVKARFRIDSLATSFDFLSLRDSAGSATLAKFNVRTNGSIRAYQGTQFTASASGAILAGTNGWLWMQYIPSTGANGGVNAYISTDGTRPGSPTAAVTIGDATATPGQLRLIGGPVVFDDVQVSETDIP